MAMAGNADIKFLSLAAQAGAYSGNGPEQVRRLKADGKTRRGARCEDAPPDWGSQQP
jgi:hypothetical protein